ncbi:hypothetical protein ACPOL_7144 (plasmid) [Acidisarcina polymorpha]|uniref:Uncharacterized protein n=2 Tax=Acidisarcina polymorpha TaxID=2211140 RepID=A0A2Z5GA33_9BACT|nr:hypothetical protein ACPOL_6916 [Acidisarcina polymorpha]AXC16336.1 hypothetical protein ACPOL_7144 [Acidisarcina polymorpha]
MSITTEAMKASTTDIGLDSISSLPAVIAYKVQPDTGSQTPIAIQVHYSNYKLVNGVQIPYTIKRFVNGKLQLEISVNRTQIQ